MGSARDHLLGFRAVSGRGEPFVAGAKVVKNVTGYDLPKLAAGSWGRLFAITELTLKVLPRPRVQTTLLIEGLDAASAVRAMARAMGSPAEVAAAAHVPAGRNGAPSRTAFRVQGFGPSVVARAGMLGHLLAGFGVTRKLDGDAADRYWQALVDLSPLQPRSTLWRLHVPPSTAPAVVSALESLSAEWMMDWAGGLVWAAGANDAAAVRGIAAQAGGHATLVRAGDSMTQVPPAFHPPAAGLAALEERVRRAFDPAGVFETGRF